MSDNKSIAESRDSVSEENIGQAIAVCRDVTNEHGRQLLEVMFELGAEKLLEQSSDSESEDAKSPREIARDLSAASPKILDNYSRLFLALFDDQGGEQPAPKAGFNQGLSLVDEGALDQEILVGRMSSVAAAETQSQFSKLNRRFCFLLNRRIMPVDSPLSPKSQAKCMTEALEILDTSDRVRQVLHQCLEQEFSNALGYLYSEINEMLIDLEILPEIKHHVWRAEVSTRARSKASLTESQRKALEELHRPESSELQEILSQVARSSTNADGEAVGIGAGEQTGTVPADEFRRESTRLSDLLRGLNQGEGVRTKSLLERLDAAADALSQPRAEGPAREVLEQVEGIASEFSKPFLRRGDTKEAYLATKIAAPLARLSVEDPSIVTNDEHVLRQAVRDLGGYADYIEVSDEKVREDVIEEFEELTEGFDLLDFEDPETIAHFAADVANKASVLRQDLKEQLQLLAKYEEGRTRLVQAQRNIDELLYKAIKGSRFPEPALEFLLGKWRSILVHCFLVSESDAPSWQAARSATDKMMTLIPEVEKGVPEQRKAEFGSLIKNVWNQLVKYASYRGSPSDLLMELGLQSEGAFSELSEDERSGLAALIGAEDNSWREVKEDDPVFVAHGMADGKVSQAKAEKAYQLWKDRLKPGSWVEISEVDPPIRCRLMRVYGNGERCIFVDGLGRVARSLNALEVLEKVKQGKLKKAA